MKSITTRRTLLKSSLTLLPLMLLNSVGCSFATVYAQIQKYVPLGLSAIQGILTIVDGAIGAAASAAMTLVKASFADLSAAVAQYQAAPAASKATLEDKIATILADIQGNFALFLSSLTISDSGLVKLVLGLSQVVLGVLAGFQNQLPSTTPSTARRQTEVRIAKQTAPLTPLHLSPKEFKARYNEIAVADGHPEIALN